MLGDDGLLARVVRFTMGSDSSWEVNRMADVLNRWLREQDGCIDVLFLADYQNGDYQWISIWESAEDFQTSYDTIWPKFTEMVGDCFQWAPLMQMYEVYKPKN